MMCGRTLAVLLVLMMLAVAACSGGSDSEEAADAPGPLEPDSVVSDGVEVNPSEVAPGDAIEVAYPDEDTGRTICLALEVDAGDGQWDYVYTLITDRAGGGARSIPAEEWEACDAQEFTGSEPDGAVLPDDLEPGSYRVCAIASPDADCGALEVSSH